MSQRTTFSYGVAEEEEDNENSPVESDPLGGNMGITSPYSRPRPPGGGNTNIGGKSGPRNLDMGETNFVNPMNPTMTLDGSEVPQQIMHSMHRGMSEFDILRVIAHIGYKTEEIKGDNSGGQNACPNGNCPTDADGNPVVNVQYQNSIFELVPYFYEFSWSERRQETLIPPPPPETGTKEKLSERDQKRFDEERGKLPKNADGFSQKCKDFLANLSSLGISLTDILKAVADQQPFDGNRSTISNKDAQIYDPAVSPAAPESILNSPINLPFKRGLYKAQTSQIYAEVYYESSSKGFLGIGRDWGGLNVSTIFHEALHSVTKMGDIRLAEALGLGKFGSPYDASLAIAKALKENDCVK